jgi:hypothetical protein
MRLMRQVGSSSRTRPRARSVQEPASTKRSMSVASPHCLADDSRGKPRRSVAAGRRRLPGPAAPFRQVEQNRACAWPLPSRPSRLRVEHKDGVSVHKKSRSGGRAGNVNLIRAGDIAPSSPSSYPRLSAGVRGSVADHRCRIAGRRPFTVRNNVLLGPIHCEAFKIGKRAVSESTLVRGAQDHSRRLACLECFLPARSTEAPTVTRFQARKAKFRYRCRKIVAA